MPGDGDNGTGEATTGGGVGTGDAGDGGGEGSGDGGGGDGETSSGGGDSGTKYETTSLTPHHTLFCRARSAQPASLP